MTRILSFQPVPFNGISNAFSIVQPPSGTSPSASGSDTLNLTSSDNSIFIVGNSGTKTIDFKGGSVSQGVSASTIDWSTGNSFFKTLSAGTTLAFSNLTDKTIVVAVTNTASNYTLAWPSLSWPGGTAPTQTTGAHTDVYTFVRINGTIYGNAVQNF